MLVRDDLQRTDFEDLLGKPANGGHSPDGRFSDPAAGYQLVTRL
jgi:hypothetical protein